MAAESVDAHKQQILQGADAAGMVQVAMVTLGH